MKLIVVKLLLTTLLLAQSFKLQESYNVETNDIYAKHLFKDIRTNFYLLTIPEHSDRFKINSKKLINEFELHGIDIKTNTTGVVTLIKSETIDTTVLKRDLEKLFKQTLPTIKIDAISLICRCQLKELPKEYKVVIKKSNLHKNSGTFYIKTRDSRHFFTYKIKATLGVIKAKDNIRNKNKIDAYNTYDDEIEFKNFNSIPLQNTSLGQVITARSIKKDTIITAQHVKKTPLIRRGERVRVLFNDGSVHIELEAKALKDGSLRDIIPVRKSDGTRLDVTVTGKGKASL